MGKEKETNVLEVKKEDKKEELKFLGPPPEMMTKNVPSVTRKSLWEKVAENPFVPFGVCVTVFALGNGLRQLVKRDVYAQQRMMRLRVGAQGFTVLAVIGGCVYASLK